MIWGQLDLLIEILRNFVNIIIDEKIFLFVLMLLSVLYIDMYLYLLYGVVIVKGFVLNLRIFCRYVWELEGYVGEMYGNICVFKFLQLELYNVKREFRNVQCIML